MQTLWSMKVNESDITFTTYFYKLTVYIMCFAVQIVILEDN